MKTKHIERKPDDICLRTSIGGNDCDGFYIVFRGDPKAVIDMLKIVVAEFEWAANHPDMGKLIHQKPKGTGGIGVSSNN